MTHPTVVAPAGTACGATASADRPEPITLVVPVRDEEATLPTLLRSIEGQTRAPDHVMFVDAGSRDASGRLLADACARHPGWHLLSIGPATPGRARNAGIARAPSDLVALADAGTVIDAHWLDRLARRASPDVDVVWGHVEPWVADAYAAAASLVFLAPPEPASDGPMRSGHVFSSVIRKALWVRVGGFPDLRAAEDLIFVRRIEELAPTVARAPEAVVHWQMPDGLAATFARFRLYSRVNVDAGEQADWHHGVARLYLASLPFWLLATARRRAWAMVPLVGFAARITHNIWERRAGRGVAWAANPAQFLRVAAITLTVDAATFAGWIDAVAARHTRR